MLLINRFLRYQNEFIIYTKSIAYSHTFVPMLTNICINLQYDNGISFDKKKVILVQVHSGEYLFRCIFYIFIIRTLLTLISS
jgi:hypothetical protein